MYDFSINLTLPPRGRRERFDEVFILFSEGREKKFSLGNPIKLPPLSPSISRNATGDTILMKDYCRGPSRYICLQHLYGESCWQIQAENRQWLDIVKVNSKKILLKGVNLQKLQFNEISHANHFSAKVIFAFDLSEYDALMKNS